MDDAINMLDMALLKMPQPGHFCFKITITSDTLIWHVG